MNDDATAEEIEALASMPRIARSSLLSTIPDLLAKDTSHYLVEYGVRVDNTDMVFHFFPPKSKKTWDPGYKMDKRLEAATKQCFDRFHYSAGFVVEMDSFYVVIKGLGSVPDPWYLVEKFFAAIDGQGAS